MAKPTIQTGAHSTLVYYWEDGGFKAAPSDTTTKTFGHEPVLTAFEGSHNAVEVLEPNTREAALWVEQNFEGSWTADFTLANPWWNRAVIDTATTSGTGPYTHTFDGEAPSSLQIVTGNTRSGEDWTLGGCVVASATISVEVPGNVGISLSGAYATLDEAQPSTQEAQVSASTAPFTFAEASLSIAGSVQRLIQSATLTIQNNTDLAYELGAREAVDFSPKARLLTVDSIQTRDDASDDAINRFMGGASVGTPERNAMTLLFDNGESGTSKRSLQYDVTDALAADFGIGNTGASDSDIENNMTERPVGVTAVAENNTSAAA